MPDREGTTRGAESVSAVEKSIRPKKRPKDLMEGEAVKRGNRSKQRIESEGTPKFRDGGMVRGCKPGQMTGKGFSGTY